MVSVCIKEYLTLFKLTIAHCLEHDKIINNYIFRFIESLSYTLNSREKNSIGSP